MSKKLDPLFFSILVVLFHVSLTIRIFGYPPFHSIGLFVMCDRYISWCLANRETERVSLMISYVPLIVMYLIIDNGM